MTGKLYAGWSQAARSILPLQLGYPSGGMRHQDRSALAAHAWAQGARTPADTARSASPGSAGEGEPWPRLPGEQGEPPGPRNAPAFSPGEKDSGKRQSFPNARSIYSCIYICFQRSCVLHDAGRFLGVGGGSFPGSFAGITRATFASGSSAAAPRLRA